MHPDAHSEVTGQFYFPEGLTEEVYRDDPYSRRPGPDTPNCADNIFRGDGAATVLKATRDGDGYRASFTLGVA